ncbi:hypothetical protein U2E24_01620 [Acinetobacter baumannii]|uniref:hypothetical protein n=1 Tax=Acinetobacter baumannii TaxID=470 RepID=UPI00112126B9|nr:hypothetical protein [Acinetobacter baumannii]EKX9006694.1 hypothetical protein [Acinetobacter baumannii]
MVLTISFLGPVSTIFAAIVATFLFNDWKEQHNKTVIANEAKTAFNLICDERHLLNDLKRKLPNFKNQEPKIYFTVNDDEAHNIFKDLLANLEESRSKLYEFVRLIEGKSIFNEISAYRDEIQNLNKKIINWREAIKNYDEVYDEYESSLQNIINLNNTILESLRAFILYEIEAS